MTYLKLSNRTKQAGDASIIALFLAIGLGMLVRLLYVSAVDFPLNDGGLFYTMTLELLDADFSLPVYTAYNLANIPYVYPPLPFYLVAILTRITNIPVIDLFRFLPALISILSIPALYLLSGQLLQTKKQVIFSIFAFALLPRAFEWLIMGGGLTRSLGYLFAILALHQILLMYTHPAPKHIVTVTLFSGLTVLSHPETSWFVVFSAGLLFLFYSRKRTGVFYSLIVAVGVFIFTAPWWITVVKYHGVSPLTAASQTGWHNWFVWLQLLRFDITGEPFVALLAVIGIIGVFATFARRYFFLPLWLAMIFMASPRSSKTLAMIPLAMLIGFGLDQIILPGIQKLAKGKLFSPALHTHSRDSYPNDKEKISAKRGNLVLAFLLFYLVFYAFFSAVTALYAEPYPVQVLSIEERSAMEWIAENTGSSSTFLVITGASNAWKDNVSEWFPTLTKRVSVATVQGYEWLPGQMVLRRDQYYDLQDCATQNLDCINRWAEEYQLTYEYIYIKKMKDDFGNAINCCYPLRIAVESSSNYNLIFDEPGAVIFKHQGE